MRIRVLSDLRLEFQRWSRVRQAIIGALAPDDTRDSRVATHFNPRLVGEVSACRFIRKNQHS